jgi:hypothetical protein
VKIGRTAIPRSIKKTETSDRECQAPRGPGFDVATFDKVLKKMARTRKNSLRAIGTSWGKRCSILWEEKTASIDPEAIFEIRSIEARRGLVFAVMPAADVEKRFGVSL